MFNRLKHSRERNNGQIGDFSYTGKPFVTVSKNNLDIKMKNKI